MGLIQKGTSVVLHERHPLGPSVLKIRKLGWRFAHEKLQEDATVKTFQGFRTGQNANETFLFVVGDGEPMQIASVDGHSVVMRTDWPLLSMDGRPSTGEVISTIESDQYVLGQHEFDWGCKNAGALRLAIVLLTETGLYPEHGGDLLAVFVDNIITRLPKWEWTLTEETIRRWAEVNLEAIK